MKKLLLGLVLLGGMVALRGDCLPLMPAKYRNMKRTSRRQAEKRCKDKHPNTALYKNNGLGQDKYGWCCNVEYLRTLPFVYKRKR